MFGYSLSACQKSASARSRDFGLRPSSFSQTHPALWRFALWTDQTVAGGAGSAIRWFEINPTTDSLFQSGTVASPTLWMFDGAISSDRLVNGPVTRFGDSMVLTLNSSSPTSEPAIWIVSKRGRAPQSTPLLVQQSQVPYLSFDCATAGSVCRWGDYSGAAPDPTANRLAPRGLVLGGRRVEREQPEPDLRHRVEDLDLQRIAVSDGRRALGR